MVRARVNCLKCGGIWIHGTPCVSPGELKPIVFDNPCVKAPEVEFRKAIRALGPLMSGSPEMGNV